MKMHENSNLLQEFAYKSFEFKSRIIAELKIYRKIRGFYQ